ncbi:hypothetical protein E4198_14055 [Streptomyces sp. RKND-216]|uniref:hypothetical protein n=1 Tax=Streptomyces sp. RKND-216 TaxID=2562581 RepID=UPI00109DF17D|nr:hypothetical protein [Streptomyces sp. RKND-216]THA25675.1 hypothetical protein E4198_14055 [Streptomyces sp. RKND-216]
MQRTTRMLRNTALLAATATALVSMAACTPGDSGGDKSKGGSESSGSESSGSDSGTGSSGKSEAKTDGGMLRLGETAAEPTEISSAKKTAEFRVTMEKVVMGEPGDLDELDDAKKYAGKVPAWLYATYEHAGGDSPIELSTINDLGVTVEGGERGRPLILIMGELSAKPADCKESSDIGELASGQSGTVCQVFLVPEGKAVETALLSRGFTTAPTEWEVD